MSDDPHNRPTPPPPRPQRPSVRRLFAAPTDSVRLKEAQERILDAMQAGVINLVRRFFGDARDIVHLALLHASHDIYNEAIARGRRQATLVYESYIEVLERMYEARERARDPRVETERPTVSMADLHEEVMRRGIELTSAELAVLCGELQMVIPMTQADE